MDKYFPVSKLEIPLDSPDDTLFILGDTVKSSLTSVNNKTSAKILQTIENLPKSSAILKEAKDNATAIMKQATNGCITITQNEHGSDCLYVSDIANYKEATRYWLLNMNGFGYSGDGGKTFKLAMTMDGAIVADFITVGTLNGELLKAGSVKAEAISQEFKTTVSNDISSAKTEVKQEFKVANAVLESSIKKTYATKTDLENTETELSTSISQTATSIRTEVNKKVNSSDFGSYMQQNYNSFLLGFNDNSNVIQINTSGISICNGGVESTNRLIRFNGNGMEIWRSGSNIVN